MTTKDYKALSRLIMYDKIKRFYEEDHQSRGASAPWSRHGRWVPSGETGTDDNGLEAKDIEHAAMVLERQDAVAIGRGGKRKTCRIRHLRHCGFSASRVFRALETSALS